MAIERSAFRGIVGGRRSRSHRSRTRFDYGDMLEQQIRALRLPTPTREHRFDPIRHWRFDVCWPDRLLFIECDGGEFVTGSRRHGGAKDTEKFNAAVLAGWTGLRFVGSQIRNGYAIQVLEQVFSETGAT